MPLKPKVYPLHRQLIDTVPNLRNRANVINPGLCDDAIQRLAPSLAQHTGCTIIDINPGPGLFSSKLHELLKPEKHVLVEPNRRFLPFLQPLLNAPGSRYQYRDWADEYQWHVPMYVADGLLPVAEVSRSQPSPLLILANFADQNATRHTKRLLGNKVGSKAFYFGRTLRSGSSFHAYGPTRMLMWMLDEEKQPLLPRTVGYRAKLAAYLELTFHVEEIVGAAPFDAKRRREDAIELESAKRVAKRMKNANIDLPPERQFDVQDIFLGSSDTSRSWHQELRELEEGFKAQKYPQFVGRPPGPLVDIGRQGVKKKGTPPRSPEFEKMRVLRNVLNGENKQINKANKFLQDQVNIDKLDRETYIKNLDGDAEQEALRTLDAMIEKYKDSLQQLRDKERDKIMFLDDDRRAFAMDPPLLMWDRRMAEPLIATEDEFSPHKSMALVDFQPKVTDEYPMTQDQSLYFDLLSTFLMGNRGPADLTNLNMLAPGAFDALVPKIPALRDPRKGGRRDVKNIRNRTLTTEQLHGIAIAWDQWLFKPDIEEVVSRSTPFLNITKRNV